MHIAIEGNIGAGKTTLGKLLSERFQTRLVLEDFSDNPFLPSFYKEPARFAFPLEMSFMAQRFMQWRDSMDPDMFKPDVISDYHFEKSLLFASHTMDPDVFPVFRRLALQLSRSLKRPDVLVYLRSSTDVLMEKIRQRGREYEQGISADYLERIELSYSNWLKQQRSMGILDLRIREKYITDNWSLDALWEEIQGVAKAAVYRQY